jgi:hypothetical protein
MFFAAAISMLSSLARDAKIAEHVTPVHDVQMPLTSRHDQRKLPACVRLPWNASSALASSMIVLLLPLLVLDSRGRRRRKEEEEE